MFGSGQPWLSHLSLRIHLRPPHLTSPHLPPPGTPTYIPDVANPLTRLLFPSHRAFLAFQLVFRSFRVWRGAIRSASTSLSTLTFFPPCTFAYDVQRPTDRPTDRTTGQPTNCLRIDVCVCVRARAPLPLPLTLSLFLSLSLSLHLCLFFFFLRLCVCMCVCVLTTQLAC